MTTNYGRNHLSTLDEKKTNKRIYKWRRLLRPPQFSGRFPLNSLKSRTLKQGKSWDYMKKKEEKEEGIWFSQIAQREQISPHRRKAPSKVVFFQHSTVQWGNHLDDLWGRCVEVLHAFKGAHDGPVYGKRTADLVWRSWHLNQGAHSSPLCRQRPRKLIRI